MMTHLAAEALEASAVEDHLAEALEVSVAEVPGAEVPLADGSYSGDRVQSIEYRGQSIEYIV